MIYYHITYYGRLPSIAKSGLHPRAGGSGAIGQAGYQGHSRNRVFFTDAEGASDWFYKAEYVADVALGPYQGNVPVLLRFPEEALPQEPKQDPAGEYPSWYVSEAIDPEMIEVFDGEDWIDLEDWEDLDPELALHPAEEPDPDDYDTEDEYEEAWARYSDPDYEDKEYGGFVDPSPFWPGSLS